MTTPRNPPSVAGFTLFEIAVAMTILALISGAIFSILWQAGDTATEIRELDRRDEEVSRFLALLRESIELLPKDGTLKMTPAEETSSGYPELTIGNSATAFLFGETIGSSEETVISLRPGAVAPDGTQTFDLAMSRSDFAPEDSTGSGMAFRSGEGDLLQADEDGRYWLPLLSGVTTAAWNYWDENGQTWIEEWTDDSKLPPLLAFSIDDAYRPVPLRVVFEVPEQVSNPQAEQTSTGTGTSTSTTSTTSSSSSSSSSGGRGGSDGRGGDGRGGDGRGGDGRGGDGRGGDGRGGDGRGGDGRGGDGRPGGPPGGPGGFRPPGGGGTPGGGGGPGGGGPGGR